MEVITQGNDSLSLITKAEIDIQISTAKAFPRSTKTFLDKAMSIATLSENVAESCSYALSRGGKTIAGPSVRLAEIVASAYGNIRYGARIIANDGKKITAQGVCHDLESNTSTTIEVSRSILQHEWKDNKKTGNMITMNEDMQIITGNAACAIAIRNAIFKVIPSALVDDIYQKTKQLVAGTEQTLPAKREKAIQHLKGMGVKESQICEALDIKRVEDIDLEKLSILRGMVSAINNGESTVKEMFDPEPANWKEATKKEQSEAFQRTMKFIETTTFENIQELRKFVSNVPVEQFKEGETILFNEAVRLKELSL